mmetsp:Transcript_9587/g.12027  ORF Transcript_9587/g.12027 Transcript_9587/m.12027 type:complete len:406 (-) Transcript_9587:202-1419(-)
MIKHGISNHVKKGEDNYAVMSSKDNMVHFFGVFDGHGGPNLSRDAARDFPLAMLELGTSPTAENIVETYFEIDAKLGRRYVSEGSTAICALIQNNDPRKASVSLSWCGDSVGIEICMISKALKFQTSIHHVQNETEIKRVELQGKARLGEINLDKDVSGPLVHVIKRGLEYEAQLVPIDLERGVKRALTTISRRKLDSGRQGPIVVQTNIDGGEEYGIIKAASTQVTRAIGDWDSARTITPHPEVVFTNYEISHDAKLDQSHYDGRSRSTSPTPLSETATINDIIDHTNLPTCVWRRFVLASDGLWDVMDTQKVTKIVIGIESPAQAAQALLVAARKRYKALNPHLAMPFKDDTTIVCFDIQLGHVPKRHRRFDVSHLFHVITDSISYPKAAVARRHKPPPASCS